MHRVGCLFDSPAPMVGTIQSVKLHPKLIKPSYNAAIFKIIAVNDYQIIPIDVYSDKYERMHFNDSSRNWTRNEYLNLSNSQWRQNYDSRYVSQYGDLYLAIDQVAFDTSRNMGSFSMPYSLPGNWSANVTARDLHFQSQDWVPYHSLRPATTDGTITNVVAPDSMRVVNGFTTESGIPSRIQISLHFMIVVIAMNLFKLIVMIYVILTDRSEYIVTLGDATASFLRRPDPTTKGNCLLSNNKSSFARRYAPAFDTLDIEAEYDASRYPKNAWLLRPQRYNSSVGIDKGVPAVLA
jgi:hypothetical protein